MCGAPAALKRQRGHAERRGGLGAAAIRAFVRRGGAAFWWVISSPVSGCDSKTNPFMSENVIILGSFAFWIICELSNS